MTKGGTLKCGAITRLPSYIRGCGDWEARGAQIADFKKGRKKTKKTKTRSYTSSEMMGPAVVVARARIRWPHMCGFKSVLGVNDEQLVSCSSCSDNKCAGPPKHSSAIRARARAAGLFLAGREAAGACTRQMDFEHALYFITTTTAIISVIIIMNR